MKKKYIPKYPLVWQKENFYIKIFCSIPNIGTGIILRTDRALFVIDPGDGTLRDLNKEIKPDQILKISDIFVSHGHHDHVGGVWSLLTYLSVMRRKPPLNIYYPKKCIEIQSIIRAFKGVYSKELTYEIRMIQIDEPKSLRRKSITIKPFRVNHREMSSDGRSTVEVPSLGFKFIYNNKSICYGGDTAYCSSLVEMAKGSDLAVIEAGAEDEDASELHMTMKQAITIGESAKEYFLVHVPE